MGVKAETAEVRCVRLEKERDAWQETAAQMGRNVEFYRKIVEQIGDMYGVAARTSDDGSVQDSVLALRVPELVKADRDALTAYVDVRKVPKK